jgi:outer membrane protein
MSKLKYLVLPLLILLVASNIYLLFFNVKPLRIATIDYKKAFNEFKLKKSLERKFEGTKFQRQKVLDSLKLELTKISNGSIPMSEAEKRSVMEAGRKEYMQLEENYMRDNQNEGALYEKQVFTQLKQFVKEFGQREAYSLILGDDQELNPLYTESANDVTTAFIEYMNSKTPIEKP